MGYQRRVHGDIQLILSYRLSLFSSTQQPFQPLESIMEFDGVYKLRTLSDDFFTLMKTMGLPEADIKLVMHPKNILTLTLMKNKDESITYMHELTMAPHMNFTITLKVKSKGLWSECVS